MTQTKMNVTPQISCSLKTEVTPIQELLISFSTGVEAEF
jgi:hypothetical protein